MPNQGFGRKIARNLSSFPDCDAHDLTPDGSHRPGMDQTGNPDRADRADLCQRHRASLGTNITLYPARSARPPTTWPKGVPLSELAANAPERYTVKGGDAVVHSKLFLKSPWRWPELWGMNMADIRTRTRIYPCQVLVLGRRDGVAALRQGRRRH